MLMALWFDSLDGQAFVYETWNTKSLQVKLEKNITLIRYLWNMLLRFILRK